MKSAMKAMETICYNPQDIKSVLEQLGYKLNDRGREWRAKPLYRESDNETALKISKSDGRWIDFARNESGNIEQLVAKTLGIPFRSAKGWIKKAGINPTSINISDEREGINLDYVKFFDPSLLNKLKKDYKYWNSRGIQKNTLDLFEGGLCFTGKMAGRYVFPIYDEKKNILGFSGRSVFENSEMKWKHVGRRSNWQYPLFLTSEHILSQKECIVIESIGDGLSLWQAGIKNFIICFGLNSLEHICYSLVKLDPAKIIIAFNNDFADGKKNGVGNQASINFKKQLECFFPKEQIAINLPKFNDFGSMTKEQITEWKTTNQNLFT